MNTASTQAKTRSPTSDVIRTWARHKADDLFVSSSPRVQTLPGRAPFRGSPSSPRYAVKIIRDVEAPDKFIKAKCPMHAVAQFPLYGALANNQCALSQRGGRPKPFAF
ncbi:jg3354 [Pararge aegeria aegeria]|uniref:Jg3354 protein n=1 Tax=Pararge aegeria aegeria TaxID=348720 RepID=A0A8S4RV35_9NEOP|nr:jg3354 [Pararge aegeria aegeria]